LELIGNIEFIWSDENLAVLNKIVANAQIYTTLLQLCIDLKCKTVPTNTRKG